MSSILLVNILLNRVLQQKKRELTKCVFSDEVKHTCNCCGHYCWNVGIIARKKIPRDVLMAVYYLRDTALEECIGCGACADICPVNAVVMGDDDRPVVDLDWCIGCGVCMVSCPADVISIQRRHDEPGPENFVALHAQIQAERQ